MNFLVRVYGDDEGPQYGFFSLDQEAITLLRQRREVFQAHKKAEPSLDEHQYTWMGLIVPDDETWHSWATAWDIDAVCDDMLVTGEHWAIIPEEVKVVVNGDTFEYERLAVDSEGSHFHAYYGDTHEIVTSTIPWSVITKEE